MRDFRHGPTRLPGSNMRQVYPNQGHSAGQRPDGAPRETHDAALLHVAASGCRSGRSGMLVSFWLPAEQPRSGLLVLMSLESVGHQREELCERRRDGMSLLEGQRSLATTSAALAAAPSRRADHLPTIHPALSHRFRMLTARRPVPRPAPPHVPCGRVAFDATSPNTSG